MEGVGVYTIGGIKKKFNRVRWSVFGNLVRVEIKEREIFVIEFVKSHSQTRLEKLPQQNGYFYDWGRVIR